jgi:polysaccharide deacetylase family protein (PEP-CTERM system associated)
MRHACTIDVEDYYQVSAFDRLVPRSSWPERASRVEASTETLLGIMAARGVRGTFFVLGSVADRHPQLVKRLAAGGHEIACHSQAHRLVYQLTPEEFRADLRQSRDTLEQLAGAAVRAYRAPSFSITPRSLWALEALAEAGFTVDSSIYPVAHDRYGMPGAPTAPYRIATPAGTLIEFPPTTVPLLGWTAPVAGGGYFRLFPFGFTNWACRRVAGLGRPVNLYLHPWEFDPEQPRLPGLPLATRFRHCVGLRHTARRFDRLLAAFSFGTMSEALAAADIGPALTPVDGRFVPAAASRVAGATA